MRFSLDFIHEFVTTPADPHKLAELLTMAGMEVERIERQGNDWVFDIEVTTNRYDWLCMVGIAREIAAITARRYKVLKPAFSVEPRYQSRDIHIQDVKDCPYYIGRSLRDVRIHEAPRWLQERIRHCGISTINNAVDSTNYAMLKWGNPLHAFDDDKLKGPICIRRAHKGEVFVGIDEKERILNSDNLVIADEEKIIALAGVMGAKNSEVDAGTKNIFLEAAIFSPLSIRRSRRSAGLDTESSYRFERRVNPRYLEYASVEAAQLIEKLARGTYAGVRRAGRLPTAKPKKISLRLDSLNAFLGSNFTRTTVSALLGRLGCRLKQQANGRLLVEAPAERFDIEQDVDLYEEVARICGYDTIDEQIPSLAEIITSELAADQRRQQFSFKNELRTFLAIAGFKEIMTWSFDNLEELTAIGERGAIAIINPLRKQENVLRKNLLSGMARCVQYNMNRGQRTVRFFEIADVYAKNQKSFLEIPLIGLAATGKADDFFCLKRTIEECLCFSGIRRYTYRKESFAGSCDGLSVWVGKYNCGWVGKIDTAFARRYDIKEEFFYGQLDLSLLLHRKAQRRYQPFSPYPLISRDISIVLCHGLAFCDIQATLETASEHLVGFCVVDTYKGKGVPQDATAFTLRLFYQSRDRTLTSQEVDAAHTALRDRLAARADVILR